MHARLWASEVSISYGDLMSMPESYFMELMREFDDILENRAKQLKTQAKK